MSADVEDLLQCSVCMESYQESGPKTPKMLPCQHSFCVQCLNGIFQLNRIQCPICRSQFSTTVEKLPKSLLIIQLLDSRRTPRGDHEVLPNLGVSKQLKEKYRDPDKATECLEKLKRKIENERQFDLEDIEAVLKCIQHYRIPNDTSRLIQVAATECIFGHISRDYGSKASVHLLSEIASEVIKTIEVFKDDRQATNLFANCLSILSHNKLLNQAKFDQLKLALLLMDILPNNARIEENIIELVNTLSRELSRSDNAVVGATRNVKILFNILRKKMKSSSSDATFSKTLGLVMSLTDETHATCRNIVSAKGVSLLTELLENGDSYRAYYDDILIILSNLTEVPELRHSILDGNARLVQRIGQLMNSGSRMSFAAVSVISRLVTIGYKDWEKLTKTQGLRRRILTDIYANVLKWESAATLNIKFRSFSFFYPLLQRYDEPPLQLYAIWTIKNFCHWQPEVYQEILIKEEGIDYLLELDENPYVDKKVKELVKQTLKSIH